VNPSHDVARESERLRQGYEVLARILRRDSSNPEAFLDAVLEEVIGLTRSGIGYIYHYDESTQQFVLNSWSNAAMEGCKVLERQTIYQLKFTGLWGEAVRRREPVVVNDYDFEPARKGLPIGHMPLKRFLTIPVIVEERIVGVVGVANSPDDYDAVDVQLLTVILGTAWKSILSWEAQNDYRTLFREMATGFAVHEILCDMDGHPIDYRFLDVNPAFERLTGFSASAILGKKVSEVIPVLAPELVARYGRVSLTGVPENFEENSSKLGKRFEVTAFRTAPGRFATAFVDVTERENAKAELLAAEERLHQTEKMRALGMLAGGIAHDFNNIVMAIQGFAELSLFHASADAALTDNLSRILRSGQRAKKLVEQIQLFSTASLPRKSPVRVVSLLEEVVEQLRGIVGVAIHVETEFEDVEAVAELEPTRMHEVFLNIGLNAVRAQPSGGLVRVSHRRVVLSQKMHARIGMIEPGEYSKIEITDTGCGMDPEILRRAFDPFFTTRPRGEGSGMGLAVVMGVVQAHGCALDVESLPGQGTTFTLWMPVSDSSPCPLDESDCFCLPGRGETILVVDDEPYLLEIFGQILSAQGYLVEIARSGHEALARLEGPGCGVDLLLTDQTMPGMSGIELASHVLAKVPELPILLCTGYQDDQLQEQAHALGVRRILSKPIEFTELARNVRTALDRSVCVE